MLVLSTERLRLRWANLQDADFVLDLLNQPSWIANIGDRNVRTLEQAEDWIAARLVMAYRTQGFGFWIVERSTDGERLGICGLTKRDTLPEVDVGYAFLPVHWGRGYAREAAAACLAHGRDRLHLRRVLAITGPDNLASSRVLEAIGMQFVEQRVLAGETRQTRIYAWGGSDTSA